MKKNAQISLSNYQNIKYYFLFAHTFIFEEPPSTREQLMNIDDDDDDVSFMW